MSENAFPFADSGDVTESSRDTKKLLVVLAGVVVLALVGAFVVLPALSGDAVDDSVVAVRRPARTAPQAPAAAVKPAPKKAVPVTATFNDTVGRDPFRPLYVAPAVSAPVSAPVFGAPVGGAPAGQTGTANPGPASQPQSSSTQVGGNRVALVDVFSRDGKTFAQTKVGDKVFTPVVGSTFATSYQLLTASGECATYLFGDEQFQLCEGQEVLK
jgi:hypothetical protein